MGIQVDPDSTGKIVDTATIGLAERVIEVIGDPTVAAAVAKVLNAAPAAADYGLVVRVAGAPAVSVSNFPATQPVSGSVAVSNFPATQPVSAAALPLPTGASTEATLALIKAKTDNIDVALSTRTKPADTQLISAAALPLPAGAATEATLDVRSGSLTEAAPANDTASSGLNGRLQRIAQRITSLIAQIPATLGQKTMANSLAVTLASDQSVLPAVAEQRAATLHVTATGAVNTAVTCTLPAPGAGLFHYITSIQVLKKYSVIGVAGPGPIITSTNLPGTPNWDTEHLAAPANTVTKVLDYQGTSALKSSVANTATTVVCPLQLQTIWRINISYYTAP